MPDEFTIMRQPLATPSLSARDILAVLFRQRRVIVAVFMVVVAIGFIYGLFTPRYHAHMRILVRKGRVDPVVTAFPAQSLPLQQDLVSEEQLNSEAELLRDDEILRAVVQGLQQKKSWMDSIWPRTNSERLALEVQRSGRRLEVTALHKTNLIEVSYASAQPEGAARFLRGLASAYLERHQRVRRPSGEFQFFDQQVTQSRGTLTSSEYRLLDFMRGRGVISAATERDSTLQKLSEAEANQRQTQIAMAETARKIRSLESRIGALPERITTATKTSGNPELMAKMKSRLLELQLQRADLLTKFEPGYRLVQEVEQQISETQQTIATEEQTPIREQTTDLNPDRVWARSEMLKSQVALDAVAAHAQAAAVEVDAYHQMAGELGERALAQDELLRELKTAEETYLLYLSKREEARIGDALDAGGILNVTIAEQPITPALPARSDISLTGITLALAGVFSTSAAFVADRLDPAFRTPDEVHAFLGTAVLACLPANQETSL